GWAAVLSPCGTTPSAQRKKRNPMSESTSNGAGRPFGILSLDGGGIRGAFTAAFAAEVEKRLGRPLADYFDLIAGTSTGAIIAVALALREPAEQIERFYRERGAD